MLHAESSLAFFLLVVGVANSFVFQWPLFKFAAANLYFGEAGGWLTFSVVFVLQFALTTACLASVATVSVRAAKACAVALFLANSLALYFVNTYGVVLDKTMLGNLINTNPAEAASFFQYKMLLYVLVLGVLPGLIIFKTAIRPLSRMKRVTHLLVIVLFGTTWLYANSRSWLWVDKHASQIGALILPWSYLVNGLRYVKSTTTSPSVQQLLPPPHLSNAAPAVVVLVIGESARAANFSLYGYQRATNPLLAANRVTALLGAKSCATYTTASLKCMLSHRGGSASMLDNYEPLPDYAQRAGVEVTWRSNNTGQPPLRVTGVKNASELRTECADMAVSSDQSSGCERNDYDEVLLKGLAQDIRTSTAKKKLVILHTSGSHGPQYFTKYPAAFEVFKPACQSVDQSQCSNVALVNAYDNSILYTDYFLGKVIALLKSLDGTPAAMLYVSDHGESLGEFGLYLHGTPYSVAPDVQKNIPFIVWTSDNFPGRSGLAARALAGANNFSHDFVFHSVLGALGMTSDIYNPNLDVFNASSGTKK